MNIQAELTEDEFEFWECAVQNHQLDLLKSIANKLHIISIRQYEATIGELEAKVALMERKNLHKCNDAWCPRCDGPR